MKTPENHESVSRVFLYRIVNPTTPLESSYDARIVVGNEAPTEVKSASIIGCYNFPTLSEVPKNFDSDLKTGCSLAGTGDLTENGLKKAVKGLIDRLSEGVAA